MENTGENLYDSFQIGQYVFKKLSFPITHFNFNKLIFCIEYFHIGLYNKYLTSDVYYATESGIKSRLIEKRFRCFADKPIENLFYFWEIVDLDENTKNFIDVFIKNFECIIGKNHYLIFYLQEIPWAVFWKKKKVGYFFENVVMKHALKYCYDESLKSKKETLKIFKTMDMKLKENIFEEKNVKFKKKFL